MSQDRTKREMKPGTNKAIVRS